MTRASNDMTSSEQPLTLDRIPDDAALLEQVLQHYQAALKDSSEAIAYLQKRGLDDPLLIEHFRLGLANRTLGYRLPHANRRAGAELRGRLQQLGVLRESGHEHLWGSLVIPVLGADGAILQMYGRKITEGLRKGTPLHVYLSSSRDVVFNERGIAGSEDIILCRSLIDALTFWRHGLRHVTALLEERAGPVLLQRLAQARRVLVAFRRDDAGEDATAALAEALAGQGVAVYRVRLPHGMDVNEYAREADDPAASLTRLVRNAEWIKGGDAPGAATPAASPIPAPSRPVASAEVNAHDVIIRLGARIWRARGLAKNTNVDALKVVLEVRPASPGAAHGDGEAFHIDGLDLLNAKSRNAFAAQAAAELGVSIDVIKREIGQVIFALEDVRDAAIKAAEAEKLEAPPQLSPEEEAEALAFLQSPDLMTRIASDMETVGIVGEGANAQAAYLAGLSRKLDRPLALLIQSTSAAGKSALMDAVLDLIPEEERVVYSAMTGQSLYYLGETNLKHKALAIAEGEGARHASYALKLLQSQGTLTMASTGKDPASGKLVTQEYRVEGPVALMLTTTAIDLDEELKNRCLVLTIDEGRDQTRAIQARQRFEETLEGLEASARRASVIKLHQSAQRLLKPLKVVNPFAERLTFLDDKTRTRRDHRKYLTLIRVIALLHQHQREVRRHTLPDGSEIEYIEATAEDVLMANKLAHAIMGATLDDLPPQTRALLVQIDAMVRERCALEHTPRAELCFARRDVRAATGWGLTQLKVHLKRLEEHEFLIARRRDGRFIYELLYNGEGQDGAAFVMGLLDPTALHATYDDARSGRGAIKSGEGEAQAAQNRPDDGADAGQSRTDGTENSASLSTPLAAPPQNASQTRITAAAHPVTSYAQPLVRGR